MEIGFSELVYISSVAGGAWAPPLAWNVCKIARFFVLLRPIFAPKMKTAPPPQRDLGADVVKDLPLFGPEKWSFLVLELTQSR